jgi:hypothetical protein
MYIHGLTIGGFADLGAFRAAELGRVVQIIGPSPAATAVGDGLAMAFAALSEPGLKALLLRWGIAQPDEAVDIETNPLPMQATWSDREMAQALVADPSARRLHAEVELVLDPPLFARLGALGAREPRLATALGNNPTIRLGVSAFFAASWDVLSIGVQSFAVGEAGFPTTSQERPRWLTDFLLEAGHRFWHHSETLDTASAAMNAMTSLDRDQHASFVAWQGALDPDFGPVRPALRSGEQPVLLAGDLPIRRFGRHGADRTSMAASVFLSGADVLWAGHTDAWVERFVEGDHSPLEQVWRIDPAGSVDPAPTDAAIRSVLAFSQAEE